MSCHVDSEFRVRAEWARSRQDVYDGHVDRVEAVVGRDVLGRPARRLLEQIVEHCGRGGSVLAVGETCHSAAPPSTFSRCVNSDGDRASAK